MLIFELNSIKESEKNDLERKEEEMVMLEEDDEMIEKITRISAELGVIVGNQE